MDSVSITHTCRGVACNAPTLCGEFNFHRRIYYTISVMMPDTAFSSVVNNPLSANNELCIELQFDPEGRAFVSHSHEESGSESELSPFSNLMNFIDSSGASLRL
jgi:hypothetical protein